MERRTLLKALALSAGGILLPMEAWSAPPARINDVRLWTAPDHTRIVFDLDKPVKHTLFRMNDPDRVVLDIEGVKLTAQTPGNVTDPVISRIKTVLPGNDMVRVVFELKTAAKPRSFFLKATKETKPRLVVDLYHGESDADTPASPSAPATSSAPSHSSASGSDRRPAPPQASAPPQKAPRGNGEITIVLDPGHGGEDPGAIGTQGTREKVITLAMGTRLAELINREPGFRAHLTRASDYFIPLRRRVAIARKHNADLFISLHADAFRERSARGASVYCLSERGKPSPDRAIEELARRENSTDLIGGVDLGDVADPEVAGILMDLSQRDSINRAMVLGGKLLGNMSSVTGLKYQSVQPAGFMVLKAPDIPSVLVEMAFLTNPEEEALLRQSTHQEKLAHALFEGVRDYRRNTKT